jgi:4'-phosphopantetheinyl transferase
MEKTPLGDREIHLWYADLMRPAVAVSELAEPLTATEHERARRFHFEKHRRRFLVRRGLLRRLLGSYLDREPSAVEFVYGEREKPFVAGEQHREPSARLEFNLSDSEDLAVYAVARGAEIGVDVEILRPMEDALSISESYFSERERDSLRSVPAELRNETFFNCWTRKEAYLKAIGEGLAEPLDSFSVTLVPGEEARFLDFRNTAEDPQSWSLVHLRPTASSVGALALRRRGWTVRELGWL